MSANPSLDTPSKEIPNELEHANGMAPPRLVSNTVITDVEPTLHWRTWLVLFAGCFCWMGINWVRDECACSSKVC